jgi:hypothetical protein
MTSCLSSRLALLPLLALALSSCAIQQSVRPVQLAADREVCIVENRSVRPGFIDSYRKALSAKGYQVRLLPAGAAITDCAVTSVYDARWRWDLALYLAFAEITVYRHGQPVGDAKYDSEGGSANLSKFVDADKKISELVNQLFPGGPGG